METPRVRPSLEPYGTYPVYQLLESASNKYPNRVAVIDGNHTYTYSELNVLAGKFASVLSNSGMSKGDRIAILSPNCAEFVIAFYGIVRMGGIVTTINSGYREMEISHQIKNSGCKVVIAHHSLNETLEKAYSLNQEK